MSTTSMRAAPKMTVITVVWNNLEGLLTTCESVGRQTYRDIEHIVVDGASTDGSVEWLASYDPGYPVEILTEPDDGLFDAMNKGIRLASGNLVVFMNGGDTFTRDDNLAFVAQEWLEGNWAWGYGGVRHVDDARRPLAGIVNVPFRKRKWELALTWVPHQATYVERRILEEYGGFRPEFGFSADQELLIRIAQVHPPRAWVEFLSDFLVGGVHSESSLGDTAMRYHRIRCANGVPILRSRILDAAYARLLGFYWAARRQIAEKVRRGP